MPHKYVKHETARHHSFLKHLEKRRPSALLLLFGFLLTFIALLVNVVVRSSYKPVTAVNAGPTSGPAQEVKGIAIQDVVPNDGAVVDQENQSPPTPTPTPKPSKPYYTIAVIGDSMVDTMGERLEYLEGALKRRYPETTFFLYNYGIGSENAEEGLKRFNDDFKYKDRTFPAISKIDTDIIIVGSWAYNPFTPADRDRHWLALTKIVQEAQKKKDVTVYMLAEIAPLRKTFGKGPGGANWDEQTSYTHSGHIVEDLQNVIGLSKTLNVPLIDVFDKSIADQKTKEGKREYVDTYDGIHPGVKGHEFMAEEIAKNLTLK